jgi:cation diffusion facilitator CzcD-associated flavoprotein CzcO
VPSLPGLETFKGECYHTSEWPEGGVDMKGKRVAVIGTGASGVQTIQEIGPEVDKLTVYQRTPNLCLPMGQVPVSKELQEEMKNDGTYETVFRRLRNTHAAFTFDLTETATFDDPPDVREAFFESLYENGGFAFWLGGYKDMFTSQAANDVAYDFWCKKVRARLNDEKKADILAPRKQPHPFGTKRPCLEQTFYEVFNQDNVDIVDLQVSPIEEITETGIKNMDGRVEEFDIIVLATGFDAMTGGMTQIELYGTDGITMAKRWKDGVYSNLGMTYHYYPNMFALYAPLGPTAFANGPTCVEIQSEWIRDVINNCRQRGITRFEATRKAEEEWKAGTDLIWNNSLFPKAKSWYQGSNIPGKPVEALNW